MVHFYLRFSTCMWAANCAPGTRGSETGTAGIDTGTLSWHSGGGQCRQALLNKEALGFISVLVGVGVWGKLVWGPEKGSWGNKV